MKKAITFGTPLALVSAYRCIPVKTRSKIGGKNRKATSQATVAMMYLGINGWVAIQIGLATWWDKATAD